MSFGLTGTRRFFALDRGGGFDFCALDHDVFHDLLEVLQQFLHEHPHDILLHWGKTAYLINPEKRIRGIIRLGSSHDEPYRPASS